jgi:hypothetical protein
LEAAYAELVREGYIETNSESVVSAGGGTKLINLGGRGKHVVSLPDENESLGRKIQKMTAAEYAEFVANPTNRRAIDNQLAGCLKVSGPRLTDLSGRQFDRLTVIDFAGRNKWNQPMWKCRCNCTNERIVCGNDLRSGGTRSCGCLTKEVRKTQVGSAHPNFKHGHALQNGHSSTYRSWQAMINRCTNPAVPGWEYYGGRGIKVCDRWQGEHGFENFISDVGLRPKGMTLDRKESNGNYEPLNCRWATAAAQDHNRRKRKNTLSQFRGVSTCVSHIYPYLSNRFWKNCFVGERWNQTAGYDL